MPQQLPPLNALRAFDAAARHLSFSKAAEELHVTTAAISHQIKSLEDYLGVQLFHRLNRGLALTEAAQAGLPKLEEGFARLAEAVHQILQHDQGEVLTVRVAPSFAAKWLVPRLQHFSALHPGIDLRIAADANLIDAKSSPDTAWDQSRYQEVDMEIRFGAGDYPGCRVDKLFPVSAVPLCSPRLLEGKHPLRTPEDLRYHTLLHDGTAYEGHPDWTAWLKAAGVEGVDGGRGLHFNYAALALEAAIDAQGVLLSLDVLATTDLAAGRLVIPFELSLPVTHASYYVISPEATAGQAKIVAFREWLLAEVRELQREQQAGKNPRMKRLAPAL